MRITHGSSMRHCVPRGIHLILLLRCDVRCLQYRSTSKVLDSRRCALQHRTSYLSIALDSRRSVSQHRSLCLSITTVQPDVDASILCIDGREQTTVDKLTSSCCAPTHPLSSGMAALPQYRRWPQEVLLPVFSSHAHMAGTTHRRRHTIRLS